MVHRHVAAWVCFAGLLGPGAPLMGQTPAPSSPAASPAPAPAPAPSRADEPAKPARDAQPAAPGGAPAAAGGITFVELPERVLVPNVGDAARMRTIKFVHGVAFKLPQHWPERDPSNPMRLVELSIPAMDGSPADDGVLTVVANVGGSADDNIARWASQFSDVQGDAVRQKIRSGALTLHCLTIRGTYNAAMPGTGKADPRKDWTLYGAVVEGGVAGPVYFKAFGPTPTMEGRKGSWEMLLRNIEPDRRPDAGAPATPGAPAVPGAPGAGDRGPKGPPSPIGTPKKAPATP